jgi:polyisoprenoid-binding protein YceI
MSSATTELDTKSLELPAEGTWELDPAHTRVEFLARHLMVTKVRRQRLRIEWRRHLSLGPG